MIGMGFLFEKIIQQLRNIIKELRLIKSVFVGDNTNKGEEKNAIRV